MTQESAYSRFIDVFGWIVVIIGASALIMEFISMPAMTICYADENVRTIVLGILFSFICIAGICLIINYCDKNIKTVTFYIWISILNFVLFLSSIYIYENSYEEYFIILFVLHVFMEFIIFGWLKYMDYDYERKRKEVKVKMIFPVDKRKSPIVCFEKFKLHESKESLEIRKKLEEIRLLRNFMPFRKLSEAEKGVFRNLSCECTDLENLKRSMEVSGLTKKDFEYLKNVQSVKLSSKELFLQELTYQANVMKQGSFNRGDVVKLVENKDSLETGSTEEKSIVNFYKAAEMILKWDDGDLVGFNWQDMIEYCTEILSTGNIDHGSDDVRKFYTPIEFDFSNNSFDAFVWCGLVFGRLMIEPSYKDFDMWKVVLVLNILLCYRGYFPVIIKQSEMKELLETISKVKDSDYEPLIKFLFRKECKMEKC